MSAPAVRERPIPFGPPMMQALLAGRKTQTRRIMKPQPTGVAGRLWPAEDRWSWLSSAARSAVDAEDARSLSPYGMQGDRLWVREAWSTAISLDKYNATQIAEQCLEANYPKPWAPLRYTVDGETVNGHPVDLARDFGGAWGRPRLARFMPRWASRITLEITNVRVQRVQEISEEDAMAEGVTEDGSLCYQNDARSHQHLDARNRYACLWDFINGKRAPWSSNPFVWAIDFRLIAAAIEREPKG